MEEYTYLSCAKEYQCFGCHCTVVLMCLLFYFGPRMPNSWKERDAAACVIAASRDQRSLPYLSPSIRDQYG